MLSAEDGLLGPGRVLHTQHPGPQLDLAHPWLASSRQGTRRTHTEDDANEAAMPGTIFRRGHAGVGSEEEMRAAHRLGGETDAFPNRSSRGENGPLIADTVHDVLRVIWVLRTGVSVR